MTTRWMGIAGLAAVSVAGACAFSTHGTGEPGSGGGILQGPAGSGGSTPTSNASSGATGGAGTTGPAGSGGAAVASSVAASTSMAASTSASTGTGIPAVHCSNNKKDADEAGVDCGGSSCPACCATANDCPSGHCADGICCDLDCTGTCQSCRGAENGGQPGTCLQATAGSDPRGACAGTQAGTCDDGGQCYCQNGVKDADETGQDCGGPTCGAGCPDGTPCGANGDCQSGHCFTPGPNGVCCDQDCPGKCNTCKNGSHWVGQCVMRPVGTKGGCSSNHACDETQACAMGGEDGASCNGDGDCVSHHCPNGTCKPFSPSGYPCIADAECSGGPCLNFFCQ